MYADIYAERHGKHAEAYAFIEPVKDSLFPETFEYVHKGSLAYIGKDAAVADIPGFTIVKGIAAGIIWKSFETVSQVSVRNIFLVASDMIRTKLFGRDISRMQ